MMNKDSITSWQTYDSVDVRRMIHQNIILNKTINLGIYVIIIQILCIFGFLIYMCFYDDFSRIIFSDATEHICIYGKGKIYSGN